MRLNLGAGKHPLDGYLNLDHKTGQEIYPLAIDDASADEIRASHVLEHFPWPLVPHIVAHWASKLKPGGVLKIAVPDFDLVIAQYQSGDCVMTQGYIMG